MTNCEIISIVQSASSGKKIQSRPLGCEDYPWADDPAPTWNFASREYRVKPEPREWWGITERAVIVCYANKESATLAFPGHTLTKVREVLE